jgi:putative transposase
MLHRAQERFPRLRHLWLDAGYRGELKGKDWALRRPWAGAWISSSVRASPPQKRCSGRGRGNGPKRGVALDWEKLMVPKGLQVLPRRWVVERTFSWIDHNRTMSKDYESCVRAARRSCRLP